MAAALPIAMAAVSAGAAIYGGYQQKQAARSEASLLEDQGRLELKESYDEADRRAKEVRKFAARQKLAYLKNGVAFDGSALDVVDETLTEGQKEVDSVTRRGQALYDLRFRQAKNMRRAGRAAFVSSFGQAANSILGASGSFGSGSGSGSSGSGSGSGGGGGF